MTDIPKEFLSDRSGLRLRIYEALGDADESTSGLLLDVCSYIAYLRNDRKSWQAFARNFPFWPLGADGETSDAPAEVENAKKRPLSADVSLPKRQKIVKLRYRVDENDNVKEEPLDLARQPSEDSDCIVVEVASKVTEVSERDLPDGNDNVEEDEGLIIAGGGDENDEDDVVEIREESDGGDDEITMISSDPALATHDVQENFSVSKPTKESIPSVCPFRSSKCSFKTQSAVEGARDWFRPIEVQFLSGTSPQGGCIYVYQTRSINEPVDKFVGRYKIPCSKIDQIMTIPPPTRTATYACHIIVVPTEAFRIERKLPDVIVWTFPRKADHKDMRGTFGEKATSNDTYLSVFARVCNDQLKAFGKELFRYDEKYDMRYSVYLDARTAGDQESFTSRGMLYFLPFGLFLGWASDSLAYIPFHAIKETFLNFDKLGLRRGAEGQNGNWVGCDLEVHVVSTLLYSKPGCKPVATVVTLRKLPISIAQANNIWKYFKRHGLPVVLQQNIFYRYEGNKKEFLEGPLPLEGHPLLCHCLSYGSYHYDYASHSKCYHK